LRSDDDSRDERGARSLAATPAVAKLERTFDALDLEAHAATKAASPDHVASPPGWIAEYGSLSRRAARR
jgi:hypothetical protein